MVTPCFTCSRVHFLRAQITMADFAIADVTDSMLDGIIDGFPNTYASKVGKTSDEMYKARLA